MSEGISGRDLSKQFFFDVVKPMFDLRIGRSYAAVHLGPGSDVLGYDDEMSQDHGWGPRISIVAELPDDERDAIVKSIEAYLPSSFQGFPLSMAEPYYQPIRLSTADGLIRSILSGVIPSPAEPLLWLVVTQQELASLTAPGVFYDEIGLANRLSYFKWYPRDIEAYLLASLWSRIGEEEHLAARVGFRGDIFGESIIRARLVRDLMRLAFLAEKRYAPYPKWFGKAFSELNCYRRVGPLLESTLTGNTYTDRQACFVSACESIAGLLADRGWAVNSQPAKKLFYSRGFEVAVHESGVVEALLGAISDPVLSHLAQKRPLGSIEIASDSVDFLENCRNRLPMLNLYCPDTQ